MYEAGSGFAIIVEKAKRWVEYFVGGYDSIMNMLIILVAIEIFIGILTSILRKRFLLKMELNIILRKLFMLMIVGVVNLFDVNLFDVNLFVGHALRSTVILFYSLQETNEIFENLSIFGVRIPPAAEKILKILDQNMEDNEKSKI